MELVVRVSSILERALYWLLALGLDLKYLWDLDVDGAQALHLHWLWPWHAVPEDLHLIFKPPFIIVSERYVMHSLALWHLRPLGGDLTHYLSCTVVWIQLFETIALLLAVEDVSREGLLGSLKLLRRGLGFYRGDVCGASCVVERAKSRRFVALNGWISDVFTRIFLPQSVEVHDEVLELFLVP